MNIPCQLEGETNTTKWHPPKGMVMKFEKKDLLDEARFIEKRCRELKPLGYDFLFVHYPPLSPALIECFEAQHKITLPEDYRFFISEVANGVSGLMYPLGLEAD